MTRLRSLLAVILLLGCGSSSSTTAARPAAAPALRAAPAPASAPAPAEPPVPLDAQIQRGTLANGLTYYVMPHRRPEQRAALWLAVNTGSVLEDDDQRGLAHFVEHMLFNGTRRFPKNEIVNLIERSGIRFGADLNAYTSFDQTVYQLLVPTDDHALLMKALDILRDWAGDASFEPAEVEKERGVVLEEWRLGRGASARIRDQLFPVLFQGSRYAERLPIGKPEVIRTAPRERLVQFYQDWYQPQNMAVIAVGDFDAAAIEKEIAARFGDLKSGARPKLRQPVPVPHDGAPAIAIATDRELAHTNVTVYDKLDHRRNETRSDYRRFLVEALYHEMLNSRFGELAQDPGAPFVDARSHTGTLTRTCDAFIRTAVAKDGRVDAAIATLFTEIARVEKLGFLPVELERARRRLLSRAESEAAEWDKTPSTEIADEMTRNFFLREQMPGRAWELAATRELLPTVTLEELNHLAATWGGDRGRVVTIGAPEKAKLPAPDAIRALIASAATQAATPWSDGGDAKPLLATAPAPGKVVKTRRDAATDTTVWTLANGVRVIAKPTTFQNDEVLFTGWKPGGSSLVADKDFVDARFAADVASAGGAGDFDRVALRKLLAGKMVDVGVGIGELTEGVSGAARPADLETALQLLHLELTAPRRDERAFAAWKDDERELLRHRRSQPEARFYDELTAITSSNHLRRRPATEDMVAQVDLDRALAIYRQRFADLGDFTFVFVGNVDLATLQPLVETYLGSLPSRGRRERWRDVGVKFPPGLVTRTVEAGSEPKSLVALAMQAPDRWSRDAERDARILSMVLGIKLREVLREDMGGVYGVQVAAGLVREPRQRRSFRVFFGCDPANVGKLRQAVFTEVGKIGRTGPDEVYLTKVREQLRRQREVDARSNRWWLGQLREAYYFGEDVTQATDIDAILGRVTRADVQRAARHFFDDKRYVLVVMTPEQAAR